MYKPPETKIDRKKRIALHLMSMMRERIPHGEKHLKIANYIGRELRKAENEIREPYL